MVALIFDRFYRYEGSSTVKCGRCWFQDVERTSTGEYSGDEVVYIVHLVALDDSEPLQCDECLTQNETYDSDEMDAEH